MEAEIDSMAGTFARKMASSSKQNVTTNLNIQEIVQAVVNNLIALPAPLPTTSEGSTNSTNETVSIELNRSFQILRGGVSRSPKHLDRNNYAHNKFNQLCWASTLKATIVQGQAQEQEDKIFLEVVDSNLICQAEMPEVARL